MTKLLLGILLGMMLTQLNYNPFEAIEWGMATFSSCLLLTSILVSEYLE